MQKIFNPINYCFQWTEDGWYKWDRKQAHKEARKARDIEVKTLRTRGERVSCFSLSNQLVRKGGIGTGQPDVEFVVNCYGFNIL